MKLILFFLVLMFCVVPVSAADWWDGYDYCKEITINQTMVSQNIGDVHFTMYINITDSNLASKAQVDGDDIVFLNAANDTQLDHQIVETFNSTTGHLQAYVNVTDISNVSSIYLYYGSAGATNTENPCGVWGVNASGIWLMDEGIGLYVNDSSSNDNNGTLENGIMWVDDGLEYDGVDDHVNTVDSNSLDFHNGDSISLFGQVVRTATSGLYWDPILSKGGEVANPDRRNYEIAFSDSDKFVFAFRDSTDVDWHIYESTPTYTTLNESFDVVATFIFGVANSTNLYVNGEHVSGSWIYGDGSANPYVSDYPLYFGSSIRTTEYFQGFTYLINIYNRILSPEIIATRYNNSEYPELFISVGTEQSKATVSAPSNIQTIPSQTWVNITWDAVPNADKYGIYELENGFPYVDTDPVMDGIKDAIYDYAHEFLIFSPNPVNLGDYGTIYPVRTSLGIYLLIECVDNDNKLGDDDTIYYFDLDNNGLTVDDPAWKITNNIVKKYMWGGASWQVTGVSNAVGASTNGSTHYPIHELFIPIAELGANWINGSTVKVLVKREDSSLSPDVISWYPYGNINDTDTSLWQEMVLNDPESYILLDNTTNLWYNATGLTPFTIYHGAVSAWNSSVESNYTLFDVITDDIPTYTVSGTVSDTDGNPIADAIVYSCNGFIHEITTTNVSGYWIGYKFREDNYTICAGKAGYYDNSIDIFVNSNLTNQNITLSTVPVIVSKYHKIGEMLFAIPTILKLVFQKIADVIPIIVVLVFIMLIINVIGVAIHAIRVWR